MSKITELALIDKLNSISKRIVYYSCLTIVNIGFATNCLNIFICINKSIQKSTMGFYNILISTFNILGFICGYLLFYPVASGKTDLLVESYFGCILISYFTRVFIQMTSWLNVMLSCDRAVCIAFPYRFKFINNKTILACIVLVLFIIILAVNVPNLLFKVYINSTYSTIANDTINTTICSSTNIVVFIRDTIIVNMRVVIPMILQFILSIILIVSILKLRKNANMTRSLRKDYQFAFTILMLNITFLITETPLMLSIINFYLIDKNNATSMAMANLFYYCGQIFSTYMLGSIFFVNILFNRIFKKELKKILRCSVLLNF